MKFIQADWDAAHNIRALTTTRLGGVSDGVYESLNLGAHINDQPENVFKNRQLLMSELGLPSEPVWLKQQHTVTVISDQGEASQPADGFYTNKINEVCAIMTADCLPLFICNQAGDEIALLHAGWRGLADGIIENGLKQFNSSSDDLIAWAGPTISRHFFEIGDDCKQQIGGSDKYYRESERKGHYYADLYGLTGERLAEVGVVNYKHSGYCTYGDDELFYSYRRDGETGRMVSLIWMEQS